MDVGFVKTTCGACAAPHRIAVRASCAEDRLGVAQSDGGFRKGARPAKAGRFAPKEPLQPERQRPCRCRLWPAASFASLGRVDAVRNRPTQGRRVPVYHILGGGLMRGRGGRLVPEFASRSHARGLPLSLGGPSSRGPLAFAGALYPAATRPQRARCPASWSTREHRKNAPTTGGAECSPKISTLGEEGMSIRTARATRGGAGQDSEPPGAPPPSHSRTTLPAGLPDHRYNRRARRLGQGRPCVDDHLQVRGNWARIGLECAGFCAKLIFRLS